MARQRPRPKRKPNLENLGTAANPQVGVGPKDHPSPRRGRSRSQGRAVSEGGSKIPWKDRPCKSFIEGKCTYGDKCKFKHPGVVTNAMAAEQSAKDKATNAEKAANKELNDGKDGEKGKKSKKRREKVPSPAKPSSS